MPGMMTSLFQAEDGATARSDATDAGAHGGTGLDLAPSVGVEAGGSYENPDGSTTEWSNATEVSLDADAAVSYTLGLGAESDAASG